MERPHLNWGDLRQANPRGTEMSIISEPPGVSDWWIGRSPPLTTSPFPSSFRTRVHSSAYRLTQSLRKIFTCPSVSQQTLSTVNVNSIKTLNVCTSAGSVFPTHPLKLMPTHNVCVFTCILFVLLGLINTPILLIGWSAGRLTARRNKYGSVLECVCSIVNELFWSKLKIRTTGGWYRPEKFIWIVSICIQTSPPLLYLPVLLYSYLSGCVSAVRAFPIRKEGSIGAWIGANEYAHRTLFRYCQLCFSQWERGLSDIDMSDQRDCWDFPCSKDKQEAQLESASSACICVHILYVCVPARARERACVCVKGIVSAWQ